MKLLIVDDEELTRTGVISAIDWKSLGIDEVLQAEDGKKGLEAARIHKPEIILCDVRMPRMDGITMLERLETILPDCIPIFMSGYSDKEYLKAAIKLKAVNYIEKPLNPQEIREAVLEARELYQQKLHSHLGKTLQSMETASRLALQLTVPYGANSGDIAVLADQLSLNITPGTSFTAIIVKLDSVPEPAGPSHEEIYEALSEFLKAHHLCCIYAEKRLQYIVYYIFGPFPPSSAVLQAAGDFLHRQYLACGKHFLAAGESFSGISRAYQSYASAVVLLQSSFFFPEGTFLSASHSQNAAGLQTAPAFVDAPEHVFAELLSAKNQEDCQRFFTALYGSYDRNQTVLPNQVKDLYYKLFTALNGVRRQLKISPAGRQDNIVDALESCFTFQELHAQLQKKTSLFFADLENSVEENSTIFLIKDYIGKHYMSESLSVKDISTHVFLSTSYVCTFFKNETGQTLNQYLTEYRMERAKQLLVSPRYKISDISSKVGYSDGNYFGKSFKKYTGLSPSEYREKMSK